jgi:hypothetical protein
MSKKRISETDLEEAFENFFGQSLANESDTTSLLIVGATVLVGVVIFGAFTVGKRSGKLLSTVVEVRRS